MPNPKQPRTDDVAVQEKPASSLKKGNGKRGFKPKSGKKPGYKDSSLKEGSAKHNDVKWYYKYPELSDASAKIGFNHIGGLAYKSVNEGNSDVNSTPVLVLQYLTSPGICENNTSGFAMQMRQLYLAMKSHYRGLNTYETPDLAITIFCIAEFYRYIAKLERIYGVCKYFNVKNRTMPSVLPVALGFDYAEITSNLANFRVGINQLILRARNLCLPSGMDVINRWFLLESNIFTDSDSARANYIVFDDRSLFYTYQPTVQNSGGSAYLSTSNALQNVMASSTALLEFGNDMLDILLTDDDITLQLGDIVAYFTAKNQSADLLTLQEIPEDYVVVPVKNEEILSQVHNATTLTELTGFCTKVSGPTVTINNWQSGSSASIKAVETFNDGGGHVEYTCIHQFNGNVIFNLHLGHNWDQAEGLPRYVESNLQNQWQSKADAILLDTWKDAPTAEDVMEMTRLSIGLTTSYRTIGGTAYRFAEVESCGSEIILQFMTYNSGDIDIEDKTLFFTSLDPTTPAWRLAMFDQFDWHPILYFISGASNAGIIPYYDVAFADLDNARVLKTSELKQMHDAAIMSEFKIGSVKIPGLDSGN